MYEGTGTYDTLKVRVHSNVMRELVHRVLHEQEETGDEEPQQLRQRQEGENDAASDDMESYEGGIIYIPFAKDFVPVVNMAERRCEITPVDGLVELAVTNFASSRRKTRSQSGRKAKGDSLRRRGKRGGKAGKPVASSSP